jgi:hypothetical protein
MFYFVLKTLQATSVFDMLYVFCEKDSEYYAANQSSIYANELDEDVVDSRFDDTVIRQRSWELNYREAAIYLQVKFNLLVHHTVCACA